VAVPLKLADGDLEGRGINERLNGRMGQIMTLICGDYSKAAANGALL